ncbi:MAG: DUF4234 domain-containing protein [Capsulimonadaceae bacterium]|nr:DUF4234 domain-containing protein [Capsulimonadaceae bacterium]
MSYSGGVFPPPPNIPPSPPPKGKYREPGIVLLLSLVTCGIYYLIWIYNASAEMNTYMGERDTDPAMEVVLSLLTCYLYTTYWDYKTGRKIARMQEKAGIAPVDNSLLYLILNLVGLGFLPHLMQQGHLNEIWAKS